MLTDLSFPKRFFGRVSSARCAPQTRWRLGRSEDVALGAPGASALALPRGRRLSAAACPSRSPGRGRAQRRLHPSLPRRALLRPRAVASAAAFRCSRQRGAQNPITFPRGASYTRQAPEGGAGVEGPPTSRRPRPRPKPGHSGGASAVSEGRAEQPTGLFVLPRAAQLGPGARLQALRPERQRPQG